MELYFSIWKLSASIHILEYAYERRAYEYLDIYVRAWKKLTIGLSRDERYGFMFCIDLLFIHVNNTIYQQVSRGTDLMLHIEPVVTGKILWWKLNSVTDWRIGSQSVAL